MKISLVIEEESKNTTNGQIRSTLSLHILLFDILSMPVVIQNEI